MTAFAERGRSPSRWSMTTTWCCSGVAHMLDQYRDRVVVAELDANEPRRRHASTSSCTTRSPSRSPTTTRSASWSPTRGRAESWSTPGTSTPTWSTAPGSRARTATCPRRLPARDLVAALEAVHAGEMRRQRPAARARSAPRAGLARPRRRADRPRGGDPGADHPGQEQRRGRRADLPQPEHREVLHPHASTARSASPAAPRPCCGASTTASPRTTTASTTGAADPEFLHRQPGNLSGMPLREHRHPRYQGLRTDKDPGDVVRETH